MRHAAGIVMLLCALAAGCTTREVLRPAATGNTVAVPADRQIVITVRNAPARTAQHAGSTAKGYDATGRYQVSQAALRDAVDIAQRYGLRQVAAWPIELLGVHCVVYAIEDDRQVGAVVAQVAGDRRVESAQPLGTFRSQNAAHGDVDPYRDLQDNLAAMQVEEAHRWSRGRGVRIAVIDSGIDVTHPDLAGRIVLRRDVTGLPAASGRQETHGTAVAGLIAADADNAQGIVGVAPEASLLALRACWQQGNESRCNTFTLAQALTLAITERADVINLSLTGPPDPLLERLLRRAMAMGKVVVSAVPESGTTRDAFPATLAGVLAVASAEAPDSVQIPGALTAPGRNVLTLRPAARYDYENGSSMAAASVSGVAALLLAAKGSVSAATIRALLQRPAAHGTLASTAGSVVNACRALTALQGAGDCAPLRRIRAARQ